MKFRGIILSIVTASFLVGCASNTESVHAPKKDDYLNSPEAQMNLDKIVKMGHKIEKGEKVETTEEKKHIESFEVSKGETPESIFNKLSILTKKIYLISNGKDFVTEIPTDKIKTENDLVLFFKVQGYNLNLEELGRYTKVSISKIQDESYNKLKEVQVEIKGYAPFDKVFQKLISDTGIIYNPNDLGTFASVPRNFYFKGNLADAIIYAANLIGVDVEFDGNKLTLSKMKTVLLDFEFPVQSTDFTANITSSTGGSSAASESSIDQESKTKTTKNGNNVSSLISKFKSNLSEKISKMLESKKSEEGHFSYIPEVGQISVTDYPNKIEDITKVVNDLNNKFKEQIKIEFKFYKYTTTVVQDRGINLSGKINDFITWGVKGGTLNTGITASNLGLNYNDGTTSAILNYLNTYGNAKVEHSFSFLVTNNNLDVIKIASNRGYVEKIDTSVTDNGVTSTDMTPASISDGTFVAAFARALSGDKIALSLFLTINDLQSFVNRSAGENTIQTPDTDEQSFNNIKTFQNNVPYIINHYEIKSDKNKKSAIPFIEDTFLDPVTSDKNDNVERTYIITEIKVSRGY